MSQSRNPNTRAFKNAFGATDKNGEKEKGQSGTGSPRTNGGASVSSNTRRRTTHGEQQSQPVFQSPVSPATTSRRRSNMNGDQQQQQFKMSMSMTVPPHSPLATVPSHSSMDFKNEPQDEDQPVTVVEVEVVEEPQHQDHNASSTSTNSNASQETVCVYGGLQYVKNVPQQNQSVFDFEDEESEGEASFVDDKETKKNLQLTKNMDNFTLLNYLDWVGGNYECASVPFHVRVIPLLFKVLKEESIFLMLTKKVEEMRQNTYLMRNRSTKALFRKVSEVLERIIVEDLNRTTQIYETVLMLLDVSGDLEHERRKIAQAKAKSQIAKAPQDSNTQGRKRKADE